MTSPTHLSGQTELPSQQNQSLAEQAYRLLEEMIVTLKLAPGTVLTEGDLSERLDIGRTPIREALQRLSAEHLVTTMPRRGIIVSEINIPEHLALLETRRVLDSLIASRAAKRATMEQKTVLRELGDKLVRAAAIPDVAEFMRLDSEADHILEQASRNIFAMRATAPLHTHCRRFWYMYQDNGDLRMSASLHAAVFNAVGQGDTALAAEASDNLLSYLERFTRMTLENY